MKKSKAETAETRKRIIEAAQREFRRNGVKGTGVSEVMAAAGLTHGGFYRHFESKEQLIAEVLDQATHIGAGNAESAAEGGPEAIRSYVESLLSKTYRDDRLDGCVLVSMGSELARSDDSVRHAASNGFKALVEAFTRYYSDAGPEAEGEAIFTMSSLIGAMTMARMIDDPAFSDRVLEEAKKRLVKTPAKASTKASTKAPAARKTPARKAPTATARRGRAPGVPHSS